MVAGADHVHHVLAGPVAVAARQHDGLEVGHTLAVGEGPGLPDLAHHVVGPVVVDPDRHPGIDQVIGLQQAHQPFFELHGGQAVGVHLADERHLEAARAVQGEFPAEVLVPAHLHLDPVARHQAVALPGFRVPVFLRRGGQRQRQQQRGQRRGEDGTAPGAIRRPRW